MLQSCLWLIAWPMTKPITSFLLTSSDSISKRAFIYLQKMDLRRLNLANYRFALDECQIDYIMKIYVAIYPVYHLQISALYRGYRWKHRKLSRKTSNSIILFLFKQKWHPTVKSGDSSTCMCQHRFKKHRSPFWRNTSILLISCLKSILVLIAGGNCVSDLTATKLEI